MAEIDIDSLRKFGYRTNVPVQNPPNIDETPSSFGNPITNSIYGINMLQTPLPVPMNKDGYGFTFFTRPQLNFQEMNLKNVRRMMNLLTEKELSMERVVRCTLDPRLQWYENMADWGGQGMSAKCRLVDPYSAFIPLLSNHLVAMSASVPDKMVPKYQSPEGQYREVHSMVDGTSNYFGAHTISATFRNSRGDPITKLFDAWVDYQSFVFEGLLVPYFDIMLGGLIDYNTRAYRVTVDPTKRYITGIAAPGAMFPLSVPKGQQYDYNIDKPYNDANNQMVIQFEANGAMWDDDILIWAFNSVVSAFNQDMLTAQTRAANMKLVPYEIAGFFNCRAYPRIDASTRRLEWWVPNTYFAVVESQTSEIIEHLLDRTSGTERSEIRSEARSQGIII